MNFNTFVIYAGILCASLSSASGLECFECTHAVDKAECQGTLQCPEGILSCRYLTLTYDNSTFFTRGCLEIYEESTDGCFEVKTMYAEKEVIEKRCYCTTDRCNGVNMQVPGKFILFFCFLASIFKAL
nr:uncharacterized protein LOC121116537 [Lepeophtheirus salmonis]